jgi:hypothetical protein
MAKAKKVSEKKKAVIRKAMFGNMTEAGTIFPKNKAGDRVKPRAKKKK